MECLNILCLCFLWLWYFRRGGRQDGSRIFVALFDYDPPTMSPNPEACDEELPFREGQLIKVCIFTKKGIQDWYFVTKTVLTYCHWFRKTLEIRGLRPRIGKFFAITRPVYSNSERSGQFWVTECFFNLFLEGSYISWIRTTIIQIGKNFGI